MTARKIVSLILISFAVSLGSYFLFSRFIINRAFGSAALAINSTTSLTVSLNGDVLGKTPFYSDSLKAGKDNLVLSSNEGSFKTKIQLTDGALTVANYSLGPSEDFSEGEIIWLEKSKDSGSLLVISDPDEVEARLDDQLLGQTPLSGRVVSVGDHSLRLSKEGYKSRTVKIQIQAGYKLNVKSRLLLLPLSAGVGRLALEEEPRFKIWDFSTANAALYADTSSWAKGFIYYTHNLESEASPSAAYDFNFFLDYKGQAFDKEAVKVSSVTLGLAPAGPDQVKVAYLGRKADGGLSDDAKQTLLNLSEKVLFKVEKVQVLPTGLGYLNVRRGPSAADAIITRVNEGDKLTLLGEEGTYFKVRLSDEIEGYIAKRYARKI